MAFLFPKKNKINKSIIKKKNNDLQNKRVWFTDGLGLGTPGTRRTVYLSGEENSASTNVRNNALTTT
jgi:hypothetical protein